MLGFLRVLPVEVGGFSLSTGTMFNTEGAWLNDSSSVGGGNGGSLGGGTGRLAVPFYVSKLKRQDVVTLTLMRCRQGCLHRRKRRELALVLLLLCY